MIYTLLSWFDQHPVAYWVGAYGSALIFLLYIGVGIFKSTTTTPARASSLAAFGLLFLVLFAGRWPILCASNFLNPDESQQIAGGITLLHHPVFWRSVDGGTAGPVNFYLLAAPGFLGFPVNYFSARMIGLLLVFGGIWFTYRTIRLVHPYFTALLGIAPLLLFFSWLTDWDLTHFSTEHVPIFLISCSAYYLLRPLYQPASVGEQKRFWALAGLAAGLTPWAKLQGSVSVMVISCVALLVTWRNQSEPIAPRLWRLAAFVAGIVIPSVLFLIMVLATHEFTAFWQSYIANNFGYVQAGAPLKVVVSSLYDLTRDSGSFHALVLVTLLSAVGVTVACIVRRRPPSAFLMFATLMVIQAVCTSLSPRRAFPHYLMFMTIPLGLFIAAAFGEYWQDERPSRLRQMLKTGIFFLVGIGLILGFRQRTPRPFTVGELAAHWRAELSGPSKAVKPYIHEEDTLALWGWYPHMFVELGAPQGVRDAHSLREIEGGPQQAYFQQRYLGDLKRNRPAVFVDAVGPGGFLFTDRSRVGHESFQELGKYIAANYKLITDVEMARVYIRNDRINLQEKSAPLPP